MRPEPDPPPPSPESDPRRTVVRSVRFSAKEWRGIQELADASGKSPTTLVREVACGAELRPRVGKVDVQLLYELGRVGNNLNQIAKHLNAGEGGEDVAPAIRELRQLIAQVRG